MSRWRGITLELGNGESLRCEPATAKRFDDLAVVLGERGGPNGCWCMWWRMRNAGWNATDSATRKQASAGRFDTSPPPGVFGYIGDRPIGWCAVAPRVEYARMQDSPTFGPIDDAPSWAISCLFIHRSARRKGVGSALVEAATAMAESYGAPAIDAIPVAPGGKRSSADLYTGTPSMFESLGFVEVARRKPERPIVRRTVR